MIVCRPEMKSQTFTSIWDAIEDTPQAAASMKARSTLLMELATVIQKRGMTQAEAAELFGITQPRISPPKPLLNCYKSQNNQTI